MSETICIPANAPKGLLVSMAIRYNHGFGMSIGMTDEEIEDFRRDQPITGRQFLTSRERESILITMNQLHEEVVGKGFYQYSDFYENYYNNLGNP